MRLPWHRPPDQGPPAAAIGVPALGAARVDADDDRPLYKDIWELLHEGGVVPFIGAGASIGERGQKQ